jgi:hypothetical protein
MTTHDPKNFRLEGDFYSGGDKTEEPKAKMNMEHPSDITDLRTKIGMGPTYGEMMNIPIEPVTVKAGQVVHINELIPAEKPVTRDLKAFQVAKARKKLSELRSNISPELKNDLNARRILQVCIILENILDGLEG